MDRDAAAGDGSADGSGQGPRTDRLVRGGRGNAYRGVGQVPGGQGPRGTDRRRPGDALLVDRRGRPVRPVVVGSRLKTLTPSGLRPRGPGTARPGRPSPPASSPPPPPAAGAAPRREPRAC